MAQRNLVSRIVYGSLYFFLYIILAGLLLITPGDAIERSVVNKQWYNIWIITVAYFITVVAVSFVYILRLYVNKTVLASIPKSWVPIDKGDVKEKVYKMIGSGLSRSASIAYAARPRVKTAENDMEVMEHEHKTRARINLWKTIPHTEETFIPLSSHRPVWGTIEHHGWASPNSQDLPNLQYSNVLSEIPNLIEAKALTQAPLDPMSQTETPVLSAEATGLLQRLPHMSLRDYVFHLAELGVVPMNDQVADFLSLYETARFSTRPMSNATFRKIMHLFADILRNMQSMYPSALDALAQEEDGGATSESESDIDNDAPAETNPSTPGNLSRPTTANTEDSVQRPARRRHTYLTAPNTPGSKMNLEMTSRKSSSSNGFAQTRRPYNGSQNTSAASLQSKSSADSGSVIRLATHDDLTDLPYVLSLRDTAATRY